MLLPEGSSKLELAGLGTYEGEVAGVRVRRTASLDGGKLNIVDHTARIPAEISVAEFAKQGAEAARLKAGDPILRTDASWPGHLSMRGRPMRWKRRLVMPARLPISWRSRAR